ncbi:MAG: YqgE/AlgH family protein [Alphaproteobacteria bacterium]|nr:YqgE/AlgH family protein [Alphaproteobacteria bacterium]
MKRDGGYLEGQLLIAMPGMSDPRFARAVLYMCAHSSTGAVGLIVNRLADHVTFPDLLRQLGIEPMPQGHEIRVHFGGPVEVSRGLILHSADYRQDSSILVGENLALTASVDMLRVIAAGDGPRHSLLALGYAGWAAGQLESEIQANAWLHATADDAMVFDDDLTSKWERAMAKIGLDVAKLAGEAGHA